MLAALAASLALLPAALAEPLAVIEHPTRVPSFAFISLGNGIEPGSSGTYGFTLANRYNASIDNVSLTVEIYRFATVTEERAIAQVAEPPTFAAGGGLVARLSFPSIPRNGSVQVRLDIAAPRGAPEGVYFTRHLLEFDYANVTEPPAPAPYTAHFVMKSRGHFTADEFASINYSDLHTWLSDHNVSGIVPDSSFSVRPPAPLWPLATLVVATAVSGTLALAYWMADQHPGRHRRLERFLLRMEGKLRIWRAVLRSRLPARSRPPKAD